MLPVLVFRWISVVGRKAELAAGAQSTRLRLCYARLSMSCDNNPGLCLVSRLRMRRTVLHRTILASQCDMLLWERERRGFEHEFGLGLRHPNTDQATPQTTSMCMTIAASFREADTFSSSIIMLRLQMKGCPVYLFDRFQATTIFLHPSTINVSFLALFLTISPGAAPPNA